MQNSTTPTTDNQHGPQAKRRFGIGLIESLLLILAIVGGVLAIKSQSLASQYRSKRMALEAEIGDLKIDDPSKYYVQLLKSDDPLEFRWRIYIPKGDDFCNYAIGHDPIGNSFRSGGGRTSESGEAIYAIRMTPLPSSSAISILSRMSIQRSSSSMISTTQNAIVHDQLLKNDLSTWEIAGKDRVESFNADEFRWLLRIRTDFNASKDRYDGLLGYGIGSNEAFNKSHAQGE